MTILSDSGAMVSNLPQTVFLNTTDMEYDMIQVLDIGCYYCVMSALEHRLVGLAIILSNTLERIHTTSDQLFNIKRT